MSKSGIKIIEDSTGSGAVLRSTDRVRILYDMQLSHGDFLVQEQWDTIALDDRNIIAGLRYGIEGMREGGMRKFKASPHLCYGDKELDRIPKNAALIVTIKSVKIEA
ncbi:MAG TPA: FKBP-type peptidyl-prolyl cis-trans isomerase [Phycisphaerae bacterium]|nr:FKBP-type peptidyl-prolyl cis-trans isomerase [Phycisphaerae bacterium]